MKNYTGTKTIKARPMTRGEYNEYRSWNMPANENAADKGYLVEYSADPKSERNHAAHEGYISWSPAHVFEEAYRVSETWLDRLTIEGDELADKLEGLLSALKNKRVPTEEVEILNKQVVAMTNYLNILCERKEKSNN